MRRNEAVALVAVALALVVAGLAWAFGPWGLLAAGVALGAVVLFVVDIGEGG